MSDDEKRFKGMSEAFERLYGPSKFYTESAIFLIHARALAAHCECLGMNAENMQSAMLVPHNPVPYCFVNYFEVMRKWNLVNEKGEPLI